MTDTPPADSTPPPPRDAGSAASDSITDPGTLLTILSDHSLVPQARQQAALEIGRRADPALGHRLVRLLWEEPEFFVRESITWALVRMGRVYLPEVASALSDSRPVVRAQAVHLLSKVGAPEYADAVLPLLDDPDPQVSVKARWMLAQLHDLRLLPRLVDALGQSDPREHDVIDQLITGYRGAAVPSLAAAVRHGTPAQREQAVEVLQSIGSPEADAAVPALRQAVHAALRADASPAEVDPSATRDDLAVSALMTLAQLTSADARAAVEDAAHATDPRAARIASVARRLLTRPPKPTSAARLRALKSRRARKAHS